MTYGYLDHDTASDPGWQPHERAEEGPGRMAGGGAGSSWWELARKRALALLHVSRLHGMFMFHSKNRSYVTLSIIFLSYCLFPVTSQPAARQTRAASCSCAEKVGPRQQVSRLQEKEHPEQWAGLALQTQSLCS